MQWAFLLILSGAACFAIFPEFKVALVSLFVIGIGMAMLQVIVNPLLRISGGEDNFAFNAVIAQLVFGIASFISPKLYSYLVTELNNGNPSNSFAVQLLSGLIPNDLPWVSIYLVFFVIAVLMLILISFVSLPDVDLKDDERTEKRGVYKMLLKKKIVLLYIIGIFCYVGTEQGLANWMSRFLEEYHQVNPQIEGANAVSRFWGLMMVGCILGMVMLKLVDSRGVLMIFSFLAMTSLGFALFGKAEYSVIAFPLCGFFFSVMWSVIFSLALNSLENHHGAFSGLLCTAITGGAIIPWLIGGLGDVISLRYSMIILMITLGYIFCIGFWAKPLINNKTIKIG